MGAGLEHVILVAEECGRYAAAGERVKRLARGPRDAWPADTCRLLPCTAFNEDGRTRGSGSA